MKTKGVSIVYHIEDNLGCGFALRMRNNKPGRIVKTVRKLWALQVDATMKMYHD